MKKLLFLFLFFLSSCGVQEDFFVPKNDIVFQKADYEKISNPIKKDIGTFSGTYYFFKDKKPLEKLGFFTDQIYDGPPEYVEGYYEEFMEYFLVGEVKLSNNQKANILKVNNIFFIEYEGKYYFMPTLSNVYSNDVFRRIRNKNVVVEEETKFLSIFGTDFEYPKNIYFQSHGQEYVLKFQYKTYDRNFFELQKIDEISQKLGKNIFIEPIGKNIELSPETQKILKLSQNEIDKLDEKVKNRYYEELRSQSIFSSDGVFLALPDGTMAIYTFKIPFEHKLYNKEYGYEVANVFHFTSETGNKKDFKNYSYMETESCGTRNGTYLYVNNFTYTFPGENVYKFMVKSKEIKPYIQDYEYEKYNTFTKTISFTGSDLQKLGTMDGKYPVYSLKDTHHPLLEGMYNYLYVGEKGEKNYQKFIDGFPIFFWNDPFGRTVLFVSHKVSAPVYCAVKPVIYLYPKEKTKIEVTLNWNKKLLTSIPKYEGKWQVYADEMGKITDIKSGKNYPYLFREDLNSFPEVEDGFVVKQENIQKFFDEKLAFMGMGEKEIQDFKNYWLIELQDEPYYFFHFYQNDVLDQIAPITITPKPEKISRILMTYYGMQKPFEIEEQQLKAFESTGYFAIERGGRKK